MKKIFTSLLSIFLIIFLLPTFALFTGAAVTDGITFDANTLLKPSKTLDTTPNTFEAWVNFPSSMSSGTRGGVILGNYGSGNPCINFEVYTNGNPRLYWVDSNKTVFDWKFTKVNVYNGEWTHLTIVRDTNNLKAYCYINGELKDTVAIKPNADITPVMPLVLGGDHRGGNGQYFKGKIASVAMYSDIRSAEEIKADMTAPGKDSLLLHYDLQSASDYTEIKDNSGNGYDIKTSATWIKDKAPVTDYAYSFMVIGDTQIVAEKHPKLFPAIYDYVVDNIESKNVKFVFGLGDITNSSTDAEWALVKENIFKMDGKVRYSLVRGNHDKTAGFSAAFPLSKYEDVIGGSYSQSMLNTWQTFEVGAIKYLVFALDYGASDSVLKWAGKVVESHPDHNVIVTTHCYLYRDGTTLDINDVCPPNSTGNNGLNNGDAMWEKFVSKHENIVLVLSGHDPCNQIIMTQTKGEKGNTVTQMLIDGQGVDSGLGGVGLVATFYISEDGKNVTVEYYSTIKEKFYLSENQFSFTLDLVEPKTSNTEESTSTENPGTPEETTSATPESSATESVSVTEAPANKGCTSTMGTGALTLSLAAPFILRARKKKGTDK